MTKRYSWIFSKLFFSLCAFAFIFFFFVAVTHAQPSIQGKVISRNSTPVRGYPIRIQSLTRAAKDIIVLTDNNGNFAVYNLASGRYRVTPMNQPAGLSKEVNVSGSKTSKLNPIRLPQ